MTAVRYVADKDISSAETRPCGDPRLPLPAARFGSSKAIASSSTRRWPTAAPLAAAACPDNDTVPYSASCLEFLNVSRDTGPRLQVVASFAAPAPCPDNDRVPYSPSCIAFLKGATETGMRWRATD